MGFALEPSSYGYELHLAEPSARPYVDHLANMGETKAAERIRLGRIPKKGEATLATIAKVLGTRIRSLIRSLFARSLFSTICT